MSFSEIYGHDNIIRRFKVLLNNNNLSHSYIFEGNDGVGKKTFAINLVKALLCKKNITDACEICNSCMKINHENHPDFMIIEPDGKSIKNQQVKDFQQFMGILPNESDRKIVIIDKSHSMTKSAQNTILKILEEPPEFALIILLTENSEELLPTIKSRCQNIKFNNLKENEIEKYLVDKFDTDIENIKLIANLSNGSIKKAIDAHSSDEFIELRKKTIEIINGIIINDSFFVINNMKFFKEYQKDIDTILELMMTWFRDLLILKETKNEDNLINKDKVDLLNKHIFKAENLNFVEIINKIKDTKNNLDNYNVNYYIAIDNLVFSMIN